MDGLKMEVKFKDLLFIYEKQISCNVKNKKKLLNFERNKFQNLINIYYDIKNNNYSVEHYNVFLIREPKKRIVMSLNIHDKIINHYVTTFILIPKLEKYLDHRNIATRKNKGSDYGIKLVKKYLELLKKYNQIYVLKLDISKYFYNIVHEVLKHMIKDELNIDEYKIVCSIIDSTNEYYVHNTILKYQKKDTNIPNYEFGKGLPIGNLTSQFLSIFYLNRLDHYIVHDLHLKYYVRYMDDFLIFHYDKHYLEKCLIKIKHQLNNIYHLKVNENKTKIMNIKEGFVFLGYSFKIKNNKTITKLRNETYCKVKRRIKKIKYMTKENKISFLKYFSSINNYRFTFKYANNYKILNYIERNY